MSEDAPASDLPIVAKDAPILDQPGRSTSESDLARNALLQLDKTPLLFILDHNGDRYPIPWKQAQDYTVWTPESAQQRPANIHHEAFQILC